MDDDDKSVSELTEEEILQRMLSVDAALWLEDAAGCEELYAKFGERLPTELASQLAARG